MPGGRPNLTWYEQFHRYKRVIFDGQPGLQALMLPNGVRNAAAQVIIPSDKTNPRNYLRDASEWFVESDAANPPPLQRVTTFVAEREQDLMALLIEGLRIYHSTGHGIVYVQSGLIHIVDGVNIAPIVEPGNPIPQGWMMFWPYYLRPLSDTSGAILDTPNRMRLLYWRINGQSGGGDWTFTSGLISDNEGQDTSQIPPQHLNPPPIDYLAVFGTDEGFYEEGLKSASELASLDAVIQEIAATYSIPVPIINAKVGVSNAVGAIMDIQGNPILAGRVRALQSVDPDGPPLEFAMAATMISDLMEEYIAKEKELYQITRIPLDLTQNRDDQMSGVSRALLAQPAVNRIEAGRRQVAQAVSGAVQTRTGRGLADIDWPRQPFDTLAERRLVAGEMFRLGLWSLNEAREYMDLQPVPGGDTIRGAQEQDPTEDPNADN